MFLRYHAKYYTIHILSLFLLLPSPFLPMASISHFRTSANSFLSQYEPLSLLLAPLLSLLFAHALRSFFHLLSQNGLKATLLGFLINSLKYNTSLHAIFLYANCSFQCVFLTNFCSLFRFAD